MPFLGETMVHSVVVSDSRGLRAPDVTRTTLWTELEVADLHCGLDWRQGEDIRRSHVSRDAAGTLQHMRFNLCQQQACLVRICVQG